MCSRRVNVVVESIRLFWTRFLVQKLDSLRESVQPGGVASSVEVPRAYVCSSSIIVSLRFILFRCTIMYVFELVNWGGLILCRDPRQYQKMLLHVVVKSLYCYGAFM